MQPYINSMYQANYLPTFILLDLMRLLQVNLLYHITWAKGGIANMNYIGKLLYLFTFFTFKYCINGNNTNVKICCLNGVYTPCYTY